MSDTKEKVAVIGAGLMGTGIAHAFASSGYTVALVDVSDAALSKARDSIAKIVADGVRLGKLSEDAAERALRRLSTTKDVAGAAADASLLVETASEALQIKTQVLREAETTLPDHAIIGTNTSALSITEIAASTRRPERVVGMHFFNPVHKMKLVELIKGLTTSDETLARAKTYCDAMAKISIAVNEAPGFTTSRMSAMLGNEAMYMLLEGTASAEDIDTALRLGLNHPMGPLELGDLTGWDTRLAVLQYLHQTLGEKFRPCPLIQKLVKAGRTGRKAGHGIYRYENGEKVPGSGLKANTL